MGPRKPKPTKKELARMKVLSDMGHSPTAIAKKIGMSNHTVSKYLSMDLFSDPEIKSFMQVIRDREIDDLCLLGGKARARLHEMLDEGKTKPIETVAIMDRTFQQRRLLEGQSTANIAYAEVSSRYREAMDRLEKLCNENPGLREFVESATGGHLKMGGEDGE
ncbi:MAG: hypothetical protein K8I29_08720 [Alphaproteobacteria bacterium]|uniref:Uncharacterized protein n=1 Tax=Candidatus Nitrobium versatile TaxID=2884831 RepID=A0A953M007_9BACT|nr:hypothetical protein [Candidatus Nitrobium versatile]